MPPVVRAVADRPGDGAEGADPWRILCASIDALCDATTRRALIAANFGEAIEARDPSSDPLVEWLGGLLGSRDRCNAIGERARRHVLETYDWDGVTLHTEAIYYSMLRGF